MDALYIYMKLKSIVIVQRSWSWIARLPGADLFTCKAVYSLFVLLMYNCNDSNGPITEGISRMGLVVRESQQEVTKVVPFLR